MAKYRVLAKKAFLDLNPGGPRLVRMGETVSYDGWPGQNLEPLDDEAKTVKEFYDRSRTDKAPLPKSAAAWLASKKGIAPVGDTMETLRARIAELEAQQGKAVAGEVLKPTAGPVEIPDDWTALTKVKRIALAKKLGADKGINAVDADTFITAEIDRRKTAAQPAVAA